MRAFILAAGVGSRLKKLTQNKPKCMVRVNGKCIIDYQLEALIEAGIKTVCIIMGFESKKLMGHLKERYSGRLDLSYVVNEDYATTNNMYSLFLASEEMHKQPFILMNGDVVFDPVIIQRLLKKETTAVCVDVGTYSDESMKVVLNLDKTGIAGISKNIRRDQALGCSIDVYRFQKEESQFFISHIENIIRKEKRLSEWTEFAMDELVRSAKMKMEPLDVQGRYWFEIDNLDDLREAEIQMGRRQLDWKKIQMAFVDMDGTLYRGDTAIEGASHFMAELRKKVPYIYFLSNNSSKSHETFQAKLQKLGIKAARAEIILSSDALISYLKYGGTKKIYLVGTQALEEVLAGEGIENTADAPEAVVLGYDTEVSYKKLLEATLLLQRNPVIPYYATHTDNVCPTENGNIPDIGSLIALIEKTTHRYPDKTFGKPNLAMVMPLYKKHKVFPPESIFFGDRIYTDYEMARNCGGRFIGLLSGESCREDFENCENIIVFPSVAAVFPRAIGPSVESQ